MVKFCQIFETPGFQDPDVVSLRQPRQRGLQQNQQDQKGPPNIPRVPGPGAGYVIPPNFETDDIPRSPGDPGTPGGSGTPGGPSAPGLPPGSGTVVPETPPNPQPGSSKTPPGRGAPPRRGLPSTDPNSSRRGQPLSPGSSEIETPQDELRFPGSSSSREDRTSPIFFVVFDNNEDESRRINAFISEITIEERAVGLWDLQVVLTDDIFAFEENSILQIGKTARVWIGYARTQLVYHGKFYITDIDLRTGRTGSGNDLIISALGEEYPLTIIERLTTHENMTNSRLADKIAKSYEFKSVIDNTDIVYESISQASTDFQFLRERSRLDGHDFYVWNEELHYHRPKFDPSGIELITDSPGNSNVAKLTISVEGWQSSALWEAHIPDPLKKELIVTSGDDFEPDPIQDAIEDNDFILESSADIVNRLRPVRRLRDEGHRRSREEVQKQLDSVTQADRYIVTASVSTFGLERIRARKTVVLRGAGRYSGIYYITNARHRITNRATRGRGGYSLEFDMVSHGRQAFNADLGTPKKELATSESQIIDIINPGNNSIVAV